jgi:penicillin amidase/acyl-homoserine-lactone acylase
VQNCNSSPFRTPVGPENPKPGDFSPTCGIEGPDKMTNRGLRLLELLGADNAITEEKFYAYKFDTQYSKESAAAQYCRDLLKAPPSEDSVVREALDVLRSWSFNATEEDKSTAIAVLSMEPIVRAQMFGNPIPDLYKTFKEKAHLLKDTFGHIDVPWWKVNRLVRGAVNTGLSGGPDTLHAVYGSWEKDHLVGEAGDCYVLMATWDRDGKVHSRSVHQFGSATSDPASPHYADQVPLFIARKTKPVWMDEDEIRRHLEGEYRPGEPRPAPKAHPPSAE